MPARKIKIEKETETPLSLEARLRAGEQVSYADVQATLPYRIVIGVTTRTPQVQLGLEWFDLAITADGKRCSLRPRRG